ncbi:MAG: MFS transporter [Dehalococcoidia bacterium]|nr:MFS transporter [Dehalococcoidia bacterium]
MEADFGVEDDTLSWFVTAYLIPFATGTIIYGRLADMFGTRRLIVFGVTLFAASSFLVAAAPTFWTAVGARALQGAGGTAIPALSMATIVHTTNLRQRPRAIGTFVIAVGLGFGLGPLVGGGLAEWAGWPGPFLFTGVALAVMVPFYWWFIPRVEGAPGQRFDVPGAFLVGIAITGGLLALNRLPNHPSDVAGVAGAIVLLPAIALFVFRSRHIAQPFVDPSILKNSRFLTLCFVGMCIQGAHFAVVVMLPLLLERYHGLGIFAVGTHLLPGAAALGAAGIGAGWLAGRLGARPFLIIGTWILFNAALAFTVAGAGWTAGQVGALYIAIAAGYGMVNAVVISAATGELPPERTGIGVGVFNLLFFLGGAITVAGVGAILRLREDAIEPWVQVFEGAPVEFSDASIVVLALATVGFLLTMALAPQGEDQPEGVPTPPGDGIGRLKPNKPSDL